jgi:hypothetical protein
MFPEAERARKFVLARTTMDAGPNIGIAIPGDSATFSCTGNHDTHV